VHLPPALVTAIDRLRQRVYLASDGRLGHRQGGWSVLLLTTTGRRTGEPRTHALLYFVHRLQLLVVASNNGADRPPAWYLNLSSSSSNAVGVARIGWLEIRCGDREDLIFLRQAAGRANDLSRAEELLQQDHEEVVSAHLRRTDTCGKSMPS
jgi:hypothetical protein